MKEGLDVAQLGQVLVDQNASKRDYLASTEKMNVVAFDHDTQKYAISFRLPSKKKAGRSFEKVIPLNRYTLGQIATHTKIPMAVIDLLSSGTTREQDELGNLLSVRLQENESQRMIRTINDTDGNRFARAFLSDRYRRLDNYDLAGAVFPVLGSLEGLEIESSQVTDERMYIKALWPKMRFDMGPTLGNNGKTVKDIVQAGICISNSEVGSGSLRVEPLIYRLVCLNGMIAQDHSVRKAHVGRNNQNEFDFGEAYELYSQETLTLDDAAFYGKVTDTVRATLTSDEKFGAIVTRFMATKGEKIVGQPQAAVQELAKKYTLNEDQTQGILTHLTQGGELSKFGLANAVTAFARDDEDQLDYDTATNLERLGGKVIELGPTEWKIISSAVHDKAKKAKSRNN